ncbi:hypothetical protein ACFOY2_01160 [Nonomuraea purpurea]|uniref:Transposase n=1 Tax=Nonomuraea purpurea TaxID=1849276 RepID=A0ABV8FZI5_9ACTN
MTLRRPAVELAEFINTQRYLDGSWSAVHEASGMVIAAATWARLELIAAYVCDRSRHSNLTRLPGGGEPV